MRLRSDERGCESLNLYWFHAIAKEREKWKVEIAQIFSYFNKEIMLTLPRDGNHTNHLEEKVEPNAVKKVRQSCVPSFCMDERKTISI